jgi:hypothetical protein
MQSLNSPGFDANILRHSGIWGASDEAVLNTVHRKKIPKNPPVSTVVPIQKLSKIPVIMCSTVKSIKYISDFLSAGFAPLYLLLNNSTLCDVGSRPGRSRNLFAYTGSGVLRLFIVEDPNLSCHFLRNIAELIMKIENLHKPRKSGILGVRL